MKKSFCGVIRGIYADSGNVYFEYFIFNGKKEGQYKLYYSNGQLSIIYNMVDNIIQGECKEYYPNNKIMRKCIYKN